jgi:hypothetical protein
MLGMEQAAGWYPNPANPAQLRWWDGDAWTDHTVPMPGWQPGWDAPPVRRRRLWPWIVFPLLGVLVLAGAGAAIYVPRLIGTFKHPIDAANVYYGDLRDGRLTDAYAHVCKRIRASTTYEQFVQEVHNSDAETGAVTKFNAHQVHRVTGHGDEAIVDIDLTTTRGQYAVQAFMLDEDGHWRSCGRRVSKK